MLMSRAEAQLEKQNAAFEQLHKDEDDILDKIQGLIKAKDDKFAMQDEMLLLHGGRGGGEGGEADQVDLGVDGEDNVQGKQQVDGRAAQVADDL